MNKKIIAFSKILLLEADNISLLSFLMVKIKCLLFCTDRTKESCPFEKISSFESQCIFVSLHL